MNTMKYGMIYNQRDIVLMPFPFSDLSQKKRRPAIILSNKEYNSRNKDIICCAVTRNLRNYKNSLKIKPKDLESGELWFESIIKPNKIFTLSQNLIVKKIASLNKRTSKILIENVNQFIAFDN